MFLINKKCFVTIFILANRVKEDKIQNNIAAFKNFYEFNFLKIVLMPKNVILNFIFLSNKIDFNKLVKKAKL